MKDQFVKAGLFLGAIAAIVYGIAKWPNAEISDIFRIWMSSVTGCIGLEMCKIAVDGEMLPGSSDTQRVFFFFGGLLAIHVSIQNICRLF